MNCECPQCESDNPTATSECSACCKRTCAECTHECGVCLDTFCRDCIEECEICGEDACSEHAALCVHCHRTTCLRCAKREPVGTYLCADCLSVRRMPDRLKVDVLHMMLADGWDKTATVMLLADDAIVELPAGSAWHDDDMGRLTTLLGENWGAQATAERFRDLWNCGNWGKASALMEKFGVCVQLWDAPLQLNMND